MSTNQINTKLKQGKEIAKKIISRKKVSNPSPIELLFTIVNENLTSKVNDILNSFGEKNTIMVFGHGTVESEIIELFGFGIVDKALTISIIQRKKSEEIVEFISKELGLQTTEHAGIVFTVPINSIEKDFYNFIVNSWGEKNE